MIQVILAANMPDRAFSTNSMISRHLKTQNQIESTREELGWPQFPNLRLLRRTNLLRVFLPFVPLGSACGLGLGLWLPRLGTAASGSMEGRRADRAAASPGQGSRGCEEQHGLWPRTRIWGGKPSWGNGIVVKKWMKCWLMFIVQVCWWILILLSIFLESVPKQMHQDLVLFFVIATGSFRTPQFAFENKDFRVGLF